MNVRKTPSPNFDMRKASIDMIVLHYTGMQTGAGALSRLCDPTAKVSAHYLVEEDGVIHRLVDELERAWHAGVASWRGQTNINDRSIGIEIVNPGHEWGYRDFPPAQIDSLMALVREIAGRHNIRPSGILGHSDVAPRRKEDPGEKFPWRRLAEAGLAPPVFDGEPDGSVGFEIAMQALAQIGYDAPAGDHAASLLAFQRRYCPQSLGQGFDPLTKAALVFVRDWFSAHN
ncbi:MAG: N-acetylmuramoyl-L-alanine amidase [Pseudomonadota bacterium]